MALDRSSTAHVFFDELKASADPVAAVRKLINSTPPTMETDHLDFKTCIDQSNQSNPTMLQEEKIKAMWSEAVGGFASVGGGVLIWGIDARPDKVTKVDAAVKEILVPKVFAFQSRLKDLLKGANDPPVGNVEFLPVLASGDDGFLVCLIPASDRGPHNCEWLINKPYKMRSGDNFVNIPPALLRRMMYPQFSPALSIVVTPSFIPIDGPEVAQRRAKGTVWFTIQVTNVGTASAKDAFLNVQSNHPLQSRAGGIWQESWSGKGESFLATKPIHVKQTTMAASVNAEVTACFRDEFEGLNQLFVPHLDGIILVFQLYAESMQPVVNSLHFTPREIMFNVVKDITP
jgi:hypothetical protein